MIVSIILFIKFENIFGNIEIFEIGWQFLTKERSPFKYWGDMIYEQYELAYCYNYAYFIFIRHVYNLYSIARLYLVKYYNIFILECT